MTLPLSPRPGTCYGTLFAPRITSCLDQLSPGQIWWRPNEASNSVGNLVLHLSGNVRQWSISGLGGVPDVRQREMEFHECGPLPRRPGISKLPAQDGEGSVREVLGKLSEDDLARVYAIQKFRVTVMEATFHVAEHLPSRRADHSNDKNADGKRLHVHSPGGRKRNKTQHLPAL